MIRTLDEWYEYAIEHGTSGDMVFDILRDWKEDSKPKTYSYLDAMNDLADVQFIQNTWQEGEQARKEVEKIIKGLCGL